jgi:hypothetical protein
MHFLDTVSDGLPQDSPLRLRPYQTHVVAEIERVIASGKRRIIVVAPTGSGKTHIAAEIIQQAFEKYRQILFIAHRNELLTQARERLAGFDISAGIGRRRPDPIYAGRSGKLKLAAQKSQPQAHHGNDDQNTEYRIFRSAHSVFPGTETPVR